MMYYETYFKHNHVQIHADIVSHANDDIRRKATKGSRVHSKVYINMTKTSKDWKFLQDTYNYGANLKPQGGKAILPTLEGWLRNSRSLWKLETEVDELHFVLTRHSLKTCLSISLPRKGRAATETHVRRSNFVMLIGLHVYCRSVFENLKMTPINSYITHDALSSNWGRKVRWCMYDACKAVIKIAKYSFGRGLICFI